MQRIQATQVDGMCGGGNPSKKILEISLHPLHLIAIRCIIREL